MWLGGLGGSCRDTMRSLKASSLFLMWVCLGERLRLLEIHGIWKALVDSYGMGWLKPLPQIS